MKPVGLTGKQFGRLTVIERVFPNSKDGHTRWRCVCSCTNLNETIVSSNMLVGLKIKSCGCLRQEAKGTKQKHGDSSRGKRHILYSCWVSMKQRCFNPKHSSFRFYGGRGITVSGEWKNNYSAFKEWALNSGWHEGLSIDRINNDGNYEPSNCRWVTMLQQHNNTRSNRNYTINGVTKSMKAWADESNINARTLKERLDSGWPIAKALALPVQKKFRGKAV